MENTFQTLLYVLFAFFGIAVHILMKYRDSITQGNPLDWKKHSIFAAISLIISVALILMRDELEAILPFSKAGSFFIGYFADSVWKNVTMFYGNKLKVQQ